jgi:hypothetical protein
VAGIALLSGGIILALVIIILLHKKTKAEPDSAPIIQEAAEIASQEPGAALCPVCGSRLEKGDRVDATLYGGGWFQDGSPRPRLAHIKGCPYCLGVKPGAGGEKRERKCPVCHKSLGDNDYLVAEFIKRNDGKKPHVTIIGCSLCQKKK